METSSPALAAGSTGTSSKLLALAPERERDEEVVHVAGRLHEAHFGASMPRVMWRGPISSIDRSACVAAEPQALEDVPHEGQLVVRDRPGP